MNLFRRSRLGHPLRVQDADQGQHCRKFRPPFDFLHRPVTSLHETRSPVRTRPQHDVGAIERCERKPSPQGAGAAQGVDRPVRAPSTAPSAQVYPSPVGVPDVVNDVFVERDVRSKTVRVQGRPCAIVDPISSIFLASIRLNR